MLALLYLISHIDRANIGNAKIEGMVQDLGMTGIQYNTILAICESQPGESEDVSHVKLIRLVFIPYILFEVPSNILLMKFERPSMYLGILVVGWGIIMTCTGLVQNFGGLMAVRVLLGIFE